MLNKKLEAALQYLPELGIKGVIQGDFLFNSGEVKTKKLQGKQYVTFHPNTIVYAVPSGTEAAKKVKAAKIGVVWHTTYIGSTFETMKASYGVDISKFKPSTNVWSQDAMLRDMTQFTMTKKDTDEVNGHLSNCGRIFNKISSTTLKTLEKDQTLAGYIETFNNTYVRKGEVVGNTKTHVDKLITHIKLKFQKEINKRKTEKGKGAQQKKLDDVLQFFSPQNKVSLQMMFDLQKSIVLAKLKIINILNRLNSAQTFLKTRDGYKVTGQEGYVAIDKLGGDAVKIVDRMEFSYANFSPEIIKGWDKPGRN
jgi:hypothetical protein